MENARALRSHFQYLYAESVKVLGRFCQQVETAVAVRNAMSTAFGDPLRDPQIADLTNQSALQVLDSLREQGFQPMLDFGWNFNFPITALKEKK